MILNGIGVLGARPALLPRGTARLRSHRPDLLGRLEVLHLLRRDPRRGASCPRRLGVRAWFRSAERPAPAAGVPDHELPRPAALPPVGRAHAPGPARQQDLLDAP